MRSDTEGKGAKRLKKVEVCEKYGVRVQLSVFECRLSPLARSALTSSASLGYSELETCEPSVIQAPRGSKA